MNCVKQRTSACVVRRRELDVVVVWSSEKLTANHLSVYQVQRFLPLIQASVGREHDPNAVTYYPIRKFMVREHA